VVVAMAPEGLWHANGVLDRRASRRLRADIDDLLPPTDVGAD
jgi:hypothetical protein